VHGTKDGAVVVHHDALINAPSMAPRRIVDLTLPELGKFQLDQGIAIPSLAAVLDAVDRDIMIYVEIKAPGIEPLVVRAIREHQATCAVHSFDHRIVKTVKSIFPAIRTGVLQTARHTDPVASLVATGAQDLWQEVSFIDEELVARAHAINTKVIAWTADDPDQWKSLKRMGVDGICTNRIAELATFSW